MTARQQRPLGSVNDSVLCSLVCQFAYVVPPYFFYTPYIKDLFEKRHERKATIFTETKLFLRNVKSRIDVTTLSTEIEVGYHQLTEIFPLS